MQWNIVKFLLFIFSSILCRVLNTCSSNLRFLTIFVFRGQRMTPHRSKKMVSLRVTGKIIRSIVSGLCFVKYALLLTSHASRSYLTSYGARYWIDTYQNLNLDIQHYALNSIRWWMTLKKRKFDIHQVHLILKASNNQNIFLILLYELR